MSTTMTLTKPAPARPATAPASATVQLAAELGCIAAVSIGGGLRLPAAPSNATAITMNRRTHTGTTYRIDLRDGIACWLDGDQQNGSGELNWAATQMCTALSGGTFIGPDDAPFVCGLVLFTGNAASSHGNDPVALSERQLRSVLDAHAAASGDERCDASYVDALADIMRSPLASA